SYLSNAGHDSACACNPSPGSHQAGCAMLGFADRGVLVPTKLACIYQVPVERIVLSDGQRRFLRIGRRPPASPFAQAFAPAPPTPSIAAGAARVSPPDGG